MKKIEFTSLAKYDKRVTGSGLIDYVDSTYNHMVNCLGEPTLDVALTPVGITVCVSKAVTLPTDVVDSTPVGCTAYSTPQPELPHSCRPQPSSLKASREPTDDVVDCPERIMVTFSSLHSFDHHVLLH